MQDMSRHFHFSFEVASADIDERAIRFKDPEELVSAISSAKAGALAQQLGNQEEAYLLTADQVVQLDEEPV